MASSSSSWYCNILLIFFSAYFPLVGPSSPFYSNTLCRGFLDPALVSIALIFSLLSATSLLATFISSPRIRRLYALLLLLELLLIASLSLSINLVTRPLHPHHKNAYQLSLYPKISRAFLHSSKRWGSFEKCIRGESVCESFYEKLAGTSNYTNFGMANLSPIEMGCCKPPSCCGFLHVNGTEWVPSPSVRSNERDCKTWRNREDLLCYSCDSCKAGFMEEVRQPWRDLISSGILPFFCSTVLQYLLLSLLARPHGDEDDGDESP